MLDRSMMMSFHTTYCPPTLAGSIHRNRTQCRRRSNRYQAVQLSSVLIQTADSGNLPEPKRNLPFPGLKEDPTRGTVGVIGGLSAFSTLIFLEKLVWWSSRDGGECVPFIVCSDPELRRTCEFSYGPVIDNLQRKRVFLEESGVQFIVMPCHLCHSWYAQVSEGCSLPFLHVGECVARELKEANLKPLEAGSNARIGVLAMNGTLEAGFYQEKLQNQGFEDVLPDRATMEHIMVPAVEALKRKDTEGARNLLRVGIQLLLVRAVNTIILASDELQGLLPHDDPLLKKCIDPMDALARSTIKCAKSKGNVHRKT